MPYSCLLQLNEYCEAKKKKKTEGNCWNKINSFVAINIHDLFNFVLYEHLYKQLFIQRIFPECEKCEEYVSKDNKLGRKTIYL